MDYKVIRSNRKTLSLSIDDDLIAVVRAPYYASCEDIDLFVNSHSEWLEQVTAKKRALLEKYNISDKELCNLIEAAADYIPKRVEYYSAIMGVKPSAVKITKAKKRFGSCSSKNSICFSCYLMLYPQQAIDYVIVHEIAHIKHHNHSKSFYSFIEQYMPDYKQRERLLK